MRQKTAWLFAGILLLSLVGCGGPSATEVFFTSLEEAGELSPREGALTAADAALPLLGASAQTLAQNPRFVPDNTGDYLATVRLFGQAASLHAGMEGGVLVSLSASYLLRPCTFSLEAGVIDAFSARYGPPADILCNGESLASLAELEDHIGSAGFGGQTQLVYSCSWFIQLEGNSYGIRFYKSSRVQSNDDYFSFSFYRGAPAASHSV